MALKRKFTEHEAYGLTQEERKLGERYLRKHKTAGIIDEVESLKLFELFLIGSSFRELQQQFPQFELGKIILTAALRGWQHDRDKMMYSLKDRVKAKVIKSVLEQVDFLTSMLGVSNTEHLSTMRHYMLDPANNPKPELRIESIREYKDVVETLNKIMAGSTPGAKSPSLLEAITPEGDERRYSLPMKGRQVRELSAAQILQIQVDDDEEKE